MNVSPSERVLECIRTTVAARLLDDFSDGQLLERFAAQRDEAAFTALLERHAPMVFGVCRRVLPDEHSAEDVLQATFLLLARKAGAIRKRDSVAAWLHGAALRLARKQMASAARASRCDRRPQQPPTNTLDDLSGRELLQILDEEVAGLPEQYRLPLVLCHLEGRSREEAAAILGWSPGQVKGRLERGRERLRDRLVRRGVALSTAATATLVTDSLLAAVPSSLLSQMARAASAQSGAGASLVSPAVQSLTEGAIRDMMMYKLKATALALFAVALLGTGAGFWLSEPSPVGGQPPRPVSLKEAQPAVAADPVKPEEARDAARQSRENLKHIAIGMHHHHDTYRSFPAPAIYAADGVTPLLSWRVALLPYIDQEALFKQFRLNEPWDSAHNKKLIAKMPAVYRIPPVQGKDATTTYYQVFVGKNCIFEEPQQGNPGDLPFGGPAGPGGGSAPAPMGAAAPGGGEGGGPGNAPLGLPMGPGAGGLALPKIGRPMPSVPGIRIADIHDGTSHTLMVVEGEADVTWTKPEDIAYSTAGRVPRLGGVFRDVAHCAFADGAVYALDKKVNDKTMRVLITRNDQVPVDRESVTDPVLTTDPDQLRGENQRIEDEIAKAAKDVSELKKRLRVGIAKRSGEEAPSPVRLLQIEQKRLIRERDDILREIETLRAKLESASGGPAKD